MAFILLLLISLSTLIRIETKSSTDQNEEIAAKQNALLGLQVAMGSIQSSAGVDSSTTASIQVDSDLGVDASKENWTGVWKNTGTYDATRNLNTYSPTLDRVLVSGEDVADELSSPAQSDWPYLVGSDGVLDPDDRVQAPPVSFSNDPGI
ncbi:MAG: hypothetical protein ACQKBT_01260, partial [Puniceicoccales bacterium]